MGVVRRFDQSFNVEWGVVRDPKAVLPGRFAAHVLVTCALLLGLLPSLSVMLPSFARPAETHAAATGTSEQLNIHLGPHDSAVAYLVVDVTVDEEFEAVVGGDWEHEAHEMIDASNWLLGQIGIAVEVGLLQRWLSDDATRDAPELLAEASGQALRRPGHMLLAVTGQAAKPLDGWSRRSRTSAIASYYRHDQARTAALVAHEMGHILGATHHEDGHICENGACIMSKAGFVRAATWCDEHAAQIWESIVFGLSAGAA